MKRDLGRIHTLLEEAENERMHLLTFLQIRQPGPIFRAMVLLGQGEALDACVFCHGHLPHLSDVLCRQPCRLTCFKMRTMVQTDRQINNNTLQVDISGSLSKSHYQCLFKTCRDYLHRCHGQRLLGCVPPFSPYLPCVCRVS